MPRKKTIQTKKTAKEEKKEVEAPKRENYFFAVGRRKASVAQVKLCPSDKAGDNDLIINKRKMKEYFPILTLQNIFLSPLKATGSTNKLKITAIVKGGGFRGQAEAVRLAISRALVEFNEEFKKPLRSLGFLTRDARVVERKKPGLKKARRAPQWQKR